MSAAIKLKATAGGSVSLQADDTLTTDEVVVVQDPIGVNQTWRDFYGIRALNTTYTNNTGQPIQVNVAGGSADVEYRFHIDGIMTGWSERAAGKANSLSAIVPNGSTYDFTATGGSIGMWSELRGD